MIRLIKKGISYDDNHLGILFIYVKKLSILNNYRYDEKDVFIEGFFTVFNDMAIYIILFYDKKILKKSIILLTYNKKVIRIVITIKVKRGNKL